MYFYANSQLYFKQFSLAWVHSLIVKKVLIQFNISAVFVYTQLNVKTVLHKTIQFCDIVKNRSISNNSL